MKEHKRSILYFILGILSPLVFIQGEVYWILVEWRKSRAWKRCQRLKRLGKLPKGDDDEGEYDATLWNWTVHDIFLGRALRENVHFLRKTGHNYKRHSDPKVSHTARELHRGCDRALFLLDYLLAGLQLRLQLRRFSFRDNSDLREYWKSHFDSTYNTLEESTRKLASSLLKPELLAAVDHTLAAQRPSLVLPTSAEEAARYELRQLKGTLWRMLPENLSRLTHPLFTSIAGLKPRDGKWNPHVSFITAYTRGKLHQIPDAETDSEMQEIQQLLEQLDASESKAQRLASRRPQTPPTPA